MLIRQVRQIYHLKFRFEITINFVFLLENLKGERPSPITTDRRLRSSTQKSLRTGKSSGKNNTSSNRDQNRNNYGNINCLR